MATFSLPVKDALPSSIGMKMGLGHRLARVVFPIPPSPTMVASTDSFLGAMIVLIQSGATGSPMVIFSILFYLTEKNSNA
jgi:hypothetical protein